MTAKGIGLWTSLGQRNPAAAVEFVSWPEVLDIVARGCERGRRQAYEAAFALFGEWARATQWIPGETSEQAAKRTAALDPSLYRRAHNGIH